MKRQILIVMAFACFSGKASAWGPDGHHAVCRIAYDLLKPHVRTKVDKLMSADTDGHRYSSFADSCTYADDIRSTGIRQKDYFLNLPRTAKAVTGSGCAGTETCVLAAIDLDYAILQSRSASPSAKATALKFLGHWLGDVHQPLHISFADDLGGNDIVATGGCGNASKLHSAWDTCLVDYQGQLGHGARPGDHAAEAQHEAIVFTYADKLAYDINPGEIADWSQGQPWQWADESFQIARQPDVQYCVMKGTACQYSATDPIFTDGVSKRTVIADATYQATFGPIVEARIKMAGVRLAKMLTVALGAN